MENIIIVASKVQGNVIETYSSSTFEKSDSMITDNCCVREKNCLDEIYIVITCQSDVFSPLMMVIIKHIVNKCIYSKHIQATEKRKGEGSPSRPAVLVFPIKMKKVALIC